MKIFRQCVPHLAYISGYLLLLVAHWNDPATRGGYALALVGAGAHLIVGETPNRRAPHG